MQTVEFSLGPLLIEIERSMNEHMGLVLGNFMPLSSDFNRIDGIQPTGIFVSSIIPASISDRCGALSVGDQILTVDETVVENTSFTPDDVLQLLESNCTKGFTQIQILPAHAILRRKGEWSLKLVVQLEFDSMILEIFSRNSQENNFLRWQTLKQICLHFQLINLTFTLSTESDQT